MTRKKPSTYYTFFFSFLLVDFYQFSKSIETKTMLINMSGVYGNKCMRWHNNKIITMLLKT